ncbi:MAG: hypothetical protein ACI9W2_002109 [Gammaproteobacteria bacterium]|jgi:hypothetical protein
MKIDGQCLCGHIEYEAVIDPDKCAICHCTDCQNHSASAYGVIVHIVGDSFHLLRGEMKTYVKTADSGTRRALTFCPECGTRIYSKTIGEGTAFWGLRVGTIRQRRELWPKVQVFKRSALPWVGDLTNLPSFDGMPPPL